MKALSIVAMSVLAAILYGVIHDQITARVCVEYFTVAHPPLLHTESPTLLGLGFGVAATWWVGLVLGVALAFAARSGRYPKVDAADLFRPVGALLVVMAIAAIVAGLTGWLLFTLGVVHVSAFWMAKIEHHKLARFTADAWAHLTSYLVGAVGGCILSVRVWRQRKASALRAGSRNAGEIKDPYSRWRPWIACAGTASFAFAILLQRVDGPNVSGVLLALGSAVCALVAVVSLLVVMAMLG